MGAEDGAVEGPPTAPPIRARRAIEAAAAGAAHQAIHGQPRAGQRGGTILTVKRDHRPSQAGGHGRQDGEQLVDGPRGRWRRVRTAAAQVQRQHPTARRRRQRHQPLVLPARHQHGIGAGGHRLAARGPLRAALGRRPGPQRAIDRPHGAVVWVRVGQVGRQQGVQRGDRHAAGGQGIGAARPAATTNADQAQSHQWQAAGATEHGVDELEQAILTVAQDGLVHLLTELVEASMGFGRLHTRRLRRLTRCREVHPPWVARCPNSSQDLAVGQNGGVPGASCGGSRFATTAASRRWGNCVGCGLRRPERPHPTQFPHRRADRRVLNLVDHLAMGHQPLILSKLESG